MYQRPRMLLGAMFFLYAISTMALNDLMINTFNIGQTLLVIIMLAFIITIMSIGKIYIHMYFLFEFLFIIYCFFQILIIPDIHRATSFWGLLNLFVSFVCYILIYNIVIHYSIYQTLFKNYLYGSAVCGIILLLNNINNLADLHRVAFYFGTDRMVALTWFGLYMCIGYALCLYLYLKNNTAALVTFSALFLLLVIISGTRKLLIFISIITAFAIIARNPGKWMREIIPYGFIFLGLFIILMNVPIFYDLFGRRFDVGIDVLFGRTNIQTDSSIVGRKLLFEQAVYYWSERPLFGQGIRAFETHLNKIDYSHPHNNFIDILCSTGIVGFIIYYSRYVYLLWKTIGLYYRDKINNAETLFFAGLIVSILSIEWWQHIYNHRPFTIVFLFVVLYLQQAKSNHKQKGKGDESYVTKK